MSLDSPMCIMSPVPISQKIVFEVEKLCLEQIRLGKMYKIRNDAKIRAAQTSTSYEEFKNIVDAAHLAPVKPSKLHQRPASDEKDL